jgi:hypothetical protein
VAKNALSVLGAVQAKLVFWRGKAAHASQRLEEIRRVMLNCLDAESKRRFPHLERRIAYAQSFPALWFVRPELLMALSTRAGEQAAQRTLHEISRMFDGLLPPSMHARPSFQAR